MPSAEMQLSYCPRCDTGFAGFGDDVFKAKVAANAKVREHLVRAQGADLDEGLHDNALALWDSTT